MQDKAAIAYAPEYRDSVMPMYQEIIADDARPAPSILKEYSEIDIPVPRVPRARYTSQAFFDREAKLMWSKVWQAACREEQIPEVGDSVLYESPAGSFIITRSEENRIQAFYNACLHRGMKLCATDTSVSKFRCPFHGFTWNLDGSLAHIPARWDFPGVTDANLKLPEAKADTWGGFVFINPDINAAPLENYLEQLPSHFAGWPRDEVYVATKIRKVIRANWKACFEAFIEGYHVAELHSQGMAWSGDTSMQYDVWPGGKNVSRFLEPVGTPSDRFSHDLDEKQRIDALYAMITGSSEPAPAPPGTPLREYIASVIREIYGSIDGRSYDELSDAETLDAIQYSLFPNLILMRSLLYPLAFRFLPKDRRVDRTYFELMIFKRKPADSSAVPETEIVELGEDDTFAESGVFPEWLALIYDQDSGGLASQHEGMLAGGATDLILSKYQEVRIRHLHHTLMSYVGEDLPGAGR